MPRQDSRYGSSSPPAPARRLLWLAQPARAQGATGRRRVPAPSALCLARCLCRTGTVRLRMQPQQRTAAAEGPRRQQLPRALAFGLPACRTGCGPGGRRALRGVVVHHVQDDLDAGAVRPRGTAACLSEVMCIVVQPCRPVHGARLASHAAHSAARKRQPVICPRACGHSGGCVPAHAKASAARTHRLGSPMVAARELTQGQEKKRPRVHAMYVLGHCQSAAACSAPLPRTPRPGE